MSISSKKAPMFRFSAVVFAVCLYRSVLPAAIAPDNSDRVIISVRDQKLMLLQNGAKVATYSVSTSKFGLGDNWGRMTTPLGFLQVAEKIGDHAPTGAVFHNRRWTGEILSPNAPGRDPVITRIIWLRGLEIQNAHAFNRCIYIHGTPEEKTIGRPASYGCIRMKSSDVAAVYDQLPLGSIVQIIQDRLPKVPKARPMPPSDTLMAELEKTKSQDQPGSKSASPSLTVEQMRVAGALAAERQKQTSTRGSSARPKDKATPVLNNGETIAQSKNPRA
jgi:lipoprotein-anchoring transpeptidase ErfK/SrfK